MPEEFYWVYMTTADKDEARKIGRALLEERLVACVNMIDQMASMYWWRGEIQEDGETVLIAKTRKTHLPGLMEKVKALHGYECPCIIALPIRDGFPGYLEWLAKETERETC